MPNNEFGDFQTPVPLAQALVKTLPPRRWAHVLEPTCGAGNFLRAALDVFPDSEVVGIETQPEYVAQAKLITKVLHANIFGFDLAKDVPWESPVGPTLVIGNPPWVTNAQLSSLDSENRPERTNFKNATGIEAITGSSNFDIAEYIWIKLLTEYADRDSLIALICKTQVARNVLLYCAKLELPVISASLRLVDAKKWFNAAVDACWFTLELGSGRPDYSADVYADLESAVPDTRIGVVAGQLVANVAAYRRSKAFDGTCPVMWRQGVKHDATEAMELVEADGPTTKSGSQVNVEAEYLFPLFKCTDVFRDKLDAVSRWMIVPQKHPGDDTTALKTVAPKLWAYLDSYGTLLDGRKSSIYRNRPRFCIFGVGDYTFTDYKIAISGFHKMPIFRMIGPYNGKPAVFDDATYLLPFSDVFECAAAHALLVGREASDLISSLAFWDSKRPVTKKLLQRIDLLAIAEAADRTALVERALEELWRLGITATADEMAQAFGQLIESWRDGGIPNNRLRGTRVRKAVLF
jgi:hypothetical protein